MRGLQFSLFLMVTFLASYAQPDLSRLDGVLTKEELIEMDTLIAENGNYVFIQKMKSGLRVALSSEALYVASLCLCNADQIFVLHASAALGNLLYQVKGGQWSTSNEFDFGMRNTGLSQDALRERQLYYRRNLWVATTMDMGSPGEVEFVIDSSLVGDLSSLRLAFGLMPKSDPNTIIGLPTQTAGDCAAFSLVQGSPEKIYRFNPDQWVSFGD